jgi:hypothetical protein
LFDESGPAEASLSKADPKAYVKDYLAYAWWRDKLQTKWDVEKYGGIGGK